MLIGGTPSVSATSAVFTRVDFKRSRISNNCFVVALDSRSNDFDTEISELIHKYPIKPTSTACRLINNGSKSRPRGDVIVLQSIEVTSKNN